MVSTRPGNMHTVPLRPAGGAQRAKRRSAPSGVRIVPVMTSSGTGLAGIETSVISEACGCEMLENKVGNAKKRADSTLLNAAYSLPYHQRAGRYQCFGARLHRTKARPDGGRVIS